MSRLPNGRFAPGTSGNPAGRPRVPEEIRTRLSEIGPEMLDRLICIAQEARREDVRMAAITKLLQYAYGTSLVPADDNSPQDERLISYLEALVKK